MITIGQLAAYAGVTVRAVRHYHRRGLLAEPPRDGSGYRRYGASDAIRLVQIRTLARAGVPLARIKELLDAEPAEPNGFDGFADTIAEVDRELADRMAALRRTRAQLARLRAGDRLFVSDDVADYLDELRRLGVSGRTVAKERDVWILLQSVVPRDADTWIADKRRAIGDPEFRALYLAYDSAFDWSPDDPRLAALAHRTVAWMCARPDRDANGRRPLDDPAVVQLAATDTTSSAWRRLAELITRGLAGK